MVGKSVLRNTNSTKNKNPGFFYYNQMRWNVEERKPSLPKSHDFKFPGAKGTLDWKLNAGSYGVFLSLFSLPPPSLALEFEIGQLCSVTSFLESKSF